MTEKESFQKALPTQILVQFVILLGSLLYVFSAATPAMAESLAEECRSIDIARCDARYAPVCARWDTGVRCIQAPCPSSESRLYTNACLACQDERVQGFRVGECAERPEPKIGRRYRVQLDQLVGRRTRNDRRGNVVDVDLGVSEPLSVVQAWIWIEGTAHPGSAESLESSGGVVELPVKLQVAMQDSFAGTVFDLARPVAQLGPFDGPFKAEGVLAPSSPHHSGSTGSPLADGRAQLELAFSESCPDTGCRFIEDAVINIHRVELVVDAMRESDLQKRDR